MKISSIISVSSLVIALTGYAGFISSNGGITEMRLPIGVICTSQDGSQLQFKPRFVDDYILRLVSVVPKPTVIENITISPVNCMKSESDDEPLLLNRCKNSLEFVHTKPIGETLLIEYGQDNETINSWTFSMQQCKVVPYYEFFP